VRSKACWDYPRERTTRLVDTISTPMLLKVVQSGNLQAAPAGDASLPVGRRHERVRHVGHAAAEGALKVILKNETGA